MYEIQSELLNFLPEEKSDKVYRERVTGIIPEVVDNLRAKLEELHKPALQIYF